MATLDVIDASAITTLAQACVNRVNDFTSQIVANSLWAAAKLGISDVHVIEAFSRACLKLIQEFSPRSLAIAMWAVASLGVSDSQVIKALTDAFFIRVNDYNPQEVSNIFWSIATLGVSNDSVISAIAKACVDRIDKLTPQAMSNSLWSAAVLNITDTAITYPLTAAVSERFKSLTRVDAAQQCLQAHYSGLSLSVDAVVHLQTILLTNHETNLTSVSQLAVSSALTRLGYSLKREVPVFNGLVTTDFMIEMPCSDGSGRLIKVSIEFDGPKHYLRPAMGSRDLVGPVDGKTRRRNALLKRSGVFEMLITIPFYEWDEVEGKRESEEEYVKRKLSEGVKG